jgi:hypothetical protein
MNKLLQQIMLSNNYLGEEWDNEVGYISFGQLDPKEIWMNI